MHRFGDFNCNNMYLSSSIRSRILQDPSYGIALKTIWGMQNYTSDFKSFM